MAFSHDPALDAHLREPLLPAPGPGAADADSVRDLLHRPMLSRGEYHARSLHMLARTVPVRRYLFQAPPVGRTHDHAYGPGHDPRLARRPHRGK